MTTIPAPAHDVLTQAEAEARAAQISETAYDLTLVLTKGAPTYGGDLTVRFTLAEAGETFLDYAGRSIERLEINGKEQPPAWNGARIILPAQTLTAGQNSVRVVYTNDYDHTGDGFHQFTDPEDGESYFYTYFEPFKQHRLFPGFDQPDIKATYRVTVTAPADWVILSNGLPARVEPADADRTRHTFEPFARYSSYLFALIAGPYHGWQETHNGIPLGFYCRKSLVPFLTDAEREELFTVTRQGLDFFGAFFDYPYPFPKYDQIFVPEFNAGAMENIGAVTHYERLVFRDPPTERQRLSRAEVILHEMAHMWFGNLVTMRWWNDLWLNESFATYMAYVAIAEATRFAEGAWKDFSTGMKGWAYRQDQLVTTHPINPVVPDTDQTVLNFDGITYGKGAAALQQLVAAIGVERFRDGMRRYFKRHAFGNATLPQFLAALQEGSGRDLDAWAKLWLETASLNTLAAVWESDGARLSSLTISQTSLPEYPTLRPHQIEIALLHDEDGTVTIESVPAGVSGAETDVPAAVGKRAPDLVFPNHNDLTFAKVALDAKSLAYVRAHLERVSDPLLRQLLWSSLWSMVRDAQLSSTDYLALVRAKLPLETDLELVEPVLGLAGAALGAYVPDVRRPAEAHALFETAWQMLQTVPRGDAQIVWARTLITVALSPEDIGHTLRLAQGELSVPGLTVDQEMRWSILARAVAFALPDAEALLAAEQQRDPSDRGERALLRAEVSRPDARVKADAWARFTGAGYGSLHLTAAALGGFNWTHQRDLLTLYVDRFFDEVTGVFDSTTWEFAERYFGALFPSYRVEPDTLARTERLLLAQGERIPTLARLLREAGDDLSRALKARALVR